MTYYEFARRVLTVFGLGIFFVAAWYLRNTLMLAFLAAILAVSLSIPVARLQMFGIRRNLAILITLVGGLMAITLFVVWLLPILIIQVADILADLPPAFEAAQEQYNNWLSEQNSTLQGFLPPLDDEQIGNAVNGLANVASPFLASAGNVLASAAINLFFLIVVSVFLLIDPKDYVRGFVMLIPPNYRERSLEIMVELRQTLTAWLTALTFSITITATLVWLIIGGVLGVPNGLALGAIAGVMTIIPNIGAIVPLIPMVIFTIADDPGKLIFVLGAYTIIQQLEANFLTPSIVKRELNIPAALVLLFQIISATLFGFLGILLAVPLLATIITLVRELYVYDALGQRGVDIDLQYNARDGMKLITQHTEEDRITVMTQTFKVIEPLSEPPEDFMGRMEGKVE